MTTDRGGGEPAATGGPVRHAPVLLAEVLAALDAGGGGRFVDATFGAGGYTAAILAASASSRVVAIDRDPDALAAGQALVEGSGGRLTLRAGRFGALEQLVEAPVDGIVLDVGVSSMQIDEAARGFSFRHDGPLDMRMERAGPSAADLVNEASEADLADILFHYGEERRSRVIARAIIERRRRGPIVSTGELVALVSRHVRTEPGLNPATRTFQALRIAVNDELAELVGALHAAERLLAPGGRLVVVTFHSLEDRIVKLFVQDRTGRRPGGSRHQPEAEAATPTFELVARGPVTAGEAELAANPRARSAKLRAVRRTAAPAGAPMAELSDLAALPDRAPGARPR